MEAVLSLREHQGLFRATLGQWIEWLRTLSEASLGFPGPSLQTNPSICQEDVLFFPGGFDWKSMAGYISSFSSGRKCGGGPGGESKAGFKSLKGQVTQPSKIHIAGDQPFPFGLQRVPAAYRQMDSPKVPYGPIIAFTS